MPSRDSTRRPDDPANAAQGLAGVFLAERPKLLGFLTNRLGSTAEAEDALQEVWVKLAGGGPPGPVADALPYLFRMCENVARDARRSEARRHAREGLWAERGADWSAGDPASPSPEEVAIERDRLSRVEAELGTLPDRTRRIFAAFRLEGLAQKEIARDHGISVSAVQKHLQRAYAVVLDARRSDSREPDAQSGAP